jgi:hypothetical protein
MSECAKGFLFAGRVGIADSTRAGEKSFVCKELNETLPRGQVRRVVSLTARSKCLTQELRGRSCSLWELSEERRLAYGCTTWDRDWISGGLQLGLVPVLSSSRALRRLLPALSAF